MIIIVHWEVECMEHESRWLCLAVTQLRTSRAWTGRCGLLLSARISTIRGFSTSSTD